MPRSAPMNHDVIDDGGLPVQRRECDDMAGIDQHAPAYSSFAWIESRAGNRKRTRANGCCT
jgi:hypothetical protein